MNVFHIPLGLGIALLAAATPASAQPAPVRQLVPYSGHLDRDGAPFDGQTALRFRLYDQPADGEALWTEVQPTVNVRDGRFAVRLGEAPVPDGAAGIADLAARGDQLYLELSVGPPAAEGIEPDWTELSGRQAIHPVPQAVWSARGSDLDVDGDLRVGGAVTVDGGVTAGGPITTSDAISGTSNPFFIRGAVNGQTVIGHNSGTVELRGAAITRGNATVTGNLDAQGAVTAGGNLTARGNLTVDGTLTQRTIRKEGGARLNIGFGQESRPINGVNTATHVCFIRIFNYNFVTAQQNQLPKCEIHQNGNGTMQLFARNSECEAECLRFAP